jgi:predicted phosphodiesterase
MTSKNILGQRLFLILVVSVFLIFSINSAFASVPYGAKTCSDTTNRLSQSFDTNTLRTDLYANAWVDALDLKTVYGNSWVGKLNSNGGSDDKGLSEPGRLTIIFAPCTTDFSKPVEIMYYFHGIHAFGFSDNLGGGISFNDFNTRIAPQLKQLVDQKRNYVLVFPELPWSSGDLGEYTSKRKGKKPGDWKDYLWDPNKGDSDLVQLHEDVLSKITSEMGIASLQVGFISMTGQSAGGRPLYQAGSLKLLDKIGGGVNKITFSDADYWRSTEMVYNNYVKDNPNVELNMLVQDPSLASAHAPTQHSIEFVKKLGGSQISGAEPDKIFKVPGHPNINYVPLKKGHGPIGEMSLAWTSGSAVAVTPTSITPTYTTSFPSSTYSSQTSTVTTTQKVERTVPQGPKDIDLAWGKLSEFIDKSKSNLVWDNLLGEWSWRKYEDVYVEEKPVQGIIPGQVLGSCGLRSSELSDIRGPPSISAQTIDKILADANSPAAGSGIHFINYGLQYNIDPAFALAFFRKESSYGKAGVAKTSKGIGNIKAPTPSCLADYKYTAGPKNPGPWCAYHTWEKSIQGWYNYMTHRGVYLPNKYRLEEILPIYAPRSPASYVSSVKTYVREYRNTESQTCSGGSGHTSATLSTPSTPSTAPSVTSSVIPGFVPTGTPFKFVVVSDYHEGDKHSGTLLQSIKQSNPAFVIFNGDTINAASGHEQDWAKFFAEMVNPLVAAGIPVLHVLGNHDYEGDSVKLAYHNNVWKSYYSQNANVYSKLTNFNYAGTFPNYYFDYAGKRFVLIDYSSDFLNQQELTWLKGVVTKNSFVFGHKQLFAWVSQCSGKGSTFNCKSFNEPGVLTKVAQLFQDTGSAYINGHRHVFYPILYHGNSKKYNFPMIFVGTTKSVDNRGMLRGYNDKETIQPASFVIFDVGSSVNVGAQILDGGTYRPFTSADSMKYFPTAEEMQKLNSNGWFSPVSVGVIS